MATPYSVVQPHIQQLQHNSTGHEDEQQYSEEWQVVDDNHNYSEQNIVNSMMNNNNAQYSTAGAGRMPESYRSTTPNRFSAYQRPIDDTVDEPRTPSSTGLIRLTLKKPMGIVFEPMYDPNQPSIQRGVRICDLPRTGAAALSRKLQVGDELLQINDTTVSRMNFDEIMDFIIEADPEAVNLLFRRPRKETLQARHGVQQKLNAAANKDAPSTVKWVDEDIKETAEPKKKKEKKSDKKKEKRSKRSKKEHISEEDTLQSSVGGDDSFPNRNKKSRKKSKAKKDPFESESFLDLLIDTICSNSNNVCRDTFRRTEDEYFSEEDESFASEAEDESTYVTFEESLESREAPKPSRKKEEPVSDYEETEDETLQESLEHRRPKKKDKVLERGHSKKAYADDATFETSDSNTRTREDDAANQPLGITDPPPPAPMPPPPAIQNGDTDEETNPAAPIRAVEFDDRFDPGADVSVMESLGGPSLLIERQRAAAHAANNNGIQTVPVEIADNFGMDYPSSFGMTRMQTIDSNPLKFYTFVVKQLLEEHEPEKVRLLDKLLAKYKGREDHLIQKLSVRYTKAAEDGGIIHEEADEAAAFTDAVKKSKASPTAEQVVNTAKERLHHDTYAEEEDEDDAQDIPMHRQHWPEKEQKEPDLEDEVDEESRSGSDFSADSVDGTSPAVIAQVSELLNYVYGKTSVPGQIDRVSTIMRAYEGREAVLLELLETKALIKANKEKENAENLPSFLRNTAHSGQKSDDTQNNDLPPVTPMAIQPQAPSSTLAHDDISSMSGVSSPAVPDRDTNGIINSNGTQGDEVEVTNVQQQRQQQQQLQQTAIKKEPVIVQPIPPPPRVEAPKIVANTSMKSSATSSTPASRPPATPDRKKKKGLFGGLFGGKKKKDGGSGGNNNASGTLTPGRSVRSTRSRKLRGAPSHEGSI